MKKILALVLVLSMVLGMTAIASAEAASYKIGLAVLTSIASSKDATADANGNAQADGTAVAVLLNGEGKLVDVAIDVAQSKMAFSAKGAVVSDLATEFKSKQELGEAYDMRKASPIGKEWFEQAAALREFAIGKTLEEIKGIALDESGHPTDADLLAGCTMKIGSMKEALIAAIEGAVDCNAKEGDKLGLGIATNMSSSKDATADAEGLCQAYSTYAAVAVNAEGVIAGCAVNCVQGNVKFDATGKITSDLAANVTDKKNLGEAYGMRKASPIGKEWFEQAAGFEAYAIGKTAADIAGIAVDEKNHPTDADLTATVTMNVAEMQGAVVKAINNAQ